MVVVVLIGYCTLVVMVMLMVTCVYKICPRKKKSEEELEKERFERFSKKYMLPRDKYLASRVDFVRKPADNLDTSQTSITCGSEHTYEDISTPRSSKPDVSMSETRRTPSPTPDKRYIVDVAPSAGIDNTSYCSNEVSADNRNTDSSNWLQTPGRLASYISFRQTSHTVLVVPSAVNALSSDSSYRENSDSDNNSMDYGSEVFLEIPKCKAVNIDNSEKINNHSLNVTQDKDNFGTSVTQGKTPDFNLSCNYESKDLSKPQTSWNTEPTYDSIKSLSIPKIKLHKSKKTASGSSDHTYQSLNSELCFNLGRGDTLERTKDDQSDSLSLRRSFESVKSGRDFTVFEINCDDDDDGNDVFMENLSGQIFHDNIISMVPPDTDSVNFSRRSYPGSIKSSHIEPLSTSKSEEERYGPFPVKRKLSVRPTKEYPIASPRFSMIRTVSGNLKPKTMTDQENPVIDTSQSVPKIKVFSLDTDFSNSSTSSNGHRNKILPDILENTISVCENTPSVSEVFDSQNDTIPPLKTYQTLRSIYGYARKSSRAKKSLKSLPSLSEQTEMEIDQHLTNNLYVKSTPLPTEETSSAFSSLVSGIL